MTQTESILKQAYNKQLLPFPPLQWTLQTFAKPFGTSSLPCFTSVGYQLRSNGSFFFYQKGFKLHPITYILFTPRIVNNQINIQSNKIHYTVSSCFVDQSYTFRSFIGSLSGIHIEVILHKTELAIRIHVKKT
jgi:hypothetical protein